MLKKPFVPKPDAVSQLRPFTWKAIELPLSKISLDLSHDIAQHKFLNNSHVILEHTGRNPAIFKAEILFNNTIYPKKNDGWRAGSLYPQLHQYFISQCSQGSTGILGHPSLGPINCKVASLSSVIDANYRSGEIVSVTFIEDHPEPDITNGILDVSQIYPQVLSGTDQYFNSFTTFNPKPPQSIKPSLTIFDTLRQIRGIVDTISSYQQRLIGYVDKIIFNFNLVVQSFNRAGNALAASVNNFARKALGLWRTYRRILNIPNRNTSTYITPFRTTFSQVQLLNGSPPAITTTAPNFINSIPPCITPFNTIRDLMGLNGRLVGQFYIPINSVITYYTEGPSHVEQKIDNGFIRLPGGTNTTLEGHFKDPNQR